MIEVPVNLKRFQEELIAMNPDNQFISYNRRSWARRFGDDNSFAFICQKHPDGISRGQIKELARTARKSGDMESIKQLFLAAMMWGYGKKGYGAFRTSRMLGDPSAPEVLQTTFSLIVSGKLLNAYQSFRLQWCGPSFFTKYFYFAGLGCEIEPKPLVLDARVARSLEDLLGTSLSRFARVNRNEHGRITSLRRYPDGYQRYVELLSRWAKELRCRADSIELFLFKPPFQFWRSVS